MQGRQDSLAPTEVIQNQRFINKSEINQDHFLVSDPNGEGQHSVSGKCQFDDKLITSTSSTGIIMLPDEVMMTVLNLNGAVKQLTLLFCIRK